MVNVLLGRINIRTRPGSYTKIHPFSTKRNDPATPHAAFRQLVASLVERNLAKPLQADEWADVVSEPPESHYLKMMCGRDISLAQPDQDLALAIDSGGQWAAVAALTSLTVYDIRERIQLFLREAASRVDMRRDFEVYFDEVARPQEVRAELARLADDGLTLLGIVLRRPNTGARGLLWLKEAMRKQRAEEASITLSNQQGDLALKRADLQEIADSAAHGELTVEGRSKSELSYSSSQNPVELPDATKLPLQRELSWSDLIGVALIVALGYWLTQLDQD